MFVYTILIVFAISCFVAAAMSFLRKGPVFSTMYFVADEKERKQMKNSANYNFVGAVFLSIAILFTLAFFGIVFHLSWLFPIIIIAAVLMVIVVFVYSLRSEIKKP